MDEADVTENDSAQDSANGTKTEIALISEIEGIDTVKGAETAGGEEAYVLICRNFYDTAKARIGMIQEAYENEDYDNYTIQVHALKSSARLIGAAEFSEQAQELENAGREGDIEKVKKDTENILNRYRWFYDRFDAIFGEGTDTADDDRPLISEEDLKRNLADMTELLEAFDFDTAKELFDTFADYKMPDGFKETYSEMKTKMADLDRDGLLELIHGGHL